MASLGYNNVHTYMYMYIHMQVKKCIQLCTCVQIHYFSVSPTTFSLTSPTTAQLLWEEEEDVEDEKEERMKVEKEGEHDVEELDYDETMEDLDLHPTGNIDEGGGDESQKLSVASDSRPGKL